MKITTQGRFTKTVRRIYQTTMFFNCRLNESSVGISLMLFGRLFQAVGPTTQKAWSQNLVPDDRLDTASLMPDVNADHSVDRLCWWFPVNRDQQCSQAPLPWSALTLWLPNKFCRNSFGTKYVFTLCHLARNKLFRFSLLAPNKIWPSTFLPAACCMILFYEKSIGPM